MADCAVARMWNFALSKEEGVTSLVTGLRTGGDRTQAFRFSGGSRF